MIPLQPREAYRLWAPTYSGETAVSEIEDRIVSAMLPPLGGLHLLDVGCGTGRRMRHSGAASALGVDLCLEMIAAGDAEAGAAFKAMVGDVRDLPLPDAAFDMVWCRLVIGHVRDCGQAYAELSRVTLPGGWVIVSDFHPAACAAGHRRTFRCADAVHEIEHHVHQLEDHLSAARAVGLTSVEIVEGRIGPEIRGHYAAAGRLALYETQVGLPVVLALAFRRWP